VRAVITGANRGIGLELARQLSARGDEVIGGVRDLASADELRRLGERVRVLALDVTKGDSVSAFSRELGGVPVDLVVNNAGSNGGTTQSLRQMADDLSLTNVVDTFQINAAGALRVSVALLPNVRAGTGKKYVHITSGMGSIADNTSGGSYAYRMSKAALNMMSMSLAVDLKSDGIISVVINPGWVQTNMGGTKAPTPVHESVRNILARIEDVTHADTGAFLNAKGGRYPW
jgi:NAD(P)-dependent dehydrogenase (short-subunit alcohol dehydrogenase family)